MALSEKLKEFVKHTERLVAFGRPFVPPHEYAMFEHKLKAALENVQQVGALEALVAKQQAALKVARDALCTCSYDDRLGSYHDETKVACAITQIDEALI